MIRPLALLTIVACLLGAAGCANSHTSMSTLGATRRASTATSTTTRAASRSLASEYLAVSRFAGAYVRFLDGGGSARELPDATRAVRALAARAGSIPASHRRGTLTMTHLRRTVGEINSYLLSARDDAHTFYAQMTLVKQHGRWLVAQLTPPDFVQVLAPAGPPPPSPPRGSTGAEDAARRFLRGYLPWLYGQAPLRVIQSASRALLAGFRGHAPRVPPTMHTLRPQVAAIAMQHHRAGWQALANVSDGSETYELVLTVTQTRGRWLVSDLSSPR